MRIDKDMNKIKNRYTVLDMLLLGAMRLCGIALNEIVRLKTMPTGPKNNKRYWAFLIVFAIEADVQESRDKRCLLCSK